MTVHQGGSELGILSVVAAVRPISESGMSVAQNGLPGVFRLGIGLKVNIGGDVDGGRSI